MTIWIDAQLSPELANWFRNREIPAHPVRDLGLRDADDEAIFQAAREADAVSITKDHDFVLLLERRGPPPRVLWLTCGNTSNRVLTGILASVWPTVLEMLEAGESLVEISEPSAP